MPVIDQSVYKAPFYLSNGHLSTILPNLIKKVKNPGYERERLELADGDFLDLDWLKGDGRQLVIIGHGLEGSSLRYYVISCARYFADKGFDVLAWNCRSCSGEMNRLPRLYHHGATEDLGSVVSHAIAQGYDSVYLVGYSMGGSMILKYLGEAGPRPLPQIRAAATFSVPCNLYNSAEVLVNGENVLYRTRFLKKLMAKMKQKAGQFPELISPATVEQVKNFEQFDEHFTAPLHGFENRQDFYNKATCDQFIPQIQVPSLIVNAKNDPLLGEKCYPEELVQKSKYVYLETPETGGHVGFPYKGINSWSEIRALEFFKDLDN